LCPQDYVQELNWCLDRSQKHADKAAENRLHQVVLEAMLLRGANLRLSSNGSKNNADRLQRQPDPEKPKAAFHVSLPVSSWAFVSQLCSITWIAAAIASCMTHLGRLVYNAGKTVSHSAAFNA